MPRPCRIHRLLRLVQLQYSLAAFLRFAVWLNLFVWLNYLLYVNSQEERGEFAGWPFRFYMDWMGIIWIRYWSPFWFAVDAVIGVLLAAALAAIRWEHVQRWWHWLRTAGTPWA